MDLSLARMLMRLYIPSTEYSPLLLLTLVTAAMNTEEGCPLEEKL